MARKVNPAVRIFNELDSMPTAAARVLADLINDRVKSRELAENPPVEKPKVKRGPRKAKVVAVSTVAEAAPAVA